MTMIFDEELYAIDLLKNGFKGILKWHDQLILAMYFRTLGFKPRQIKNKIIDFIIKNDAPYNEVLNGNSLDDAIKKSKDQKLKKAEPVFITKNEIEKIKTLNNYDLEKILFIMLVISRHRKNNSKSVYSEYYLSLKFVTILRQSKLYLTRKESDAIKFKLGELGFIEPCETYWKKRTKVVDNFKLLYADENSEPEIIIKDLNKAIDYYPFLCQCCHKQIIRKNGTQKYCSSCAKLLKLITKSVG
jgi:hypothetical protein